MSTSDLNFKDPRTGEKWGKVSEGAASLLNVIGKTKEDEKNLRKSLVTILLAIFKSFLLAPAWAVLEKPWNFLSSPSTPLFLLSSTPQSVFSIPTVPVHLLLWIPSAICLLFGLTLNQLLASFSTITFSRGLVLIFITQQHSKVGRGMETVRNFGLWLPIYFATLLLLSNLDSVRELFDTLSEFFIFSPWSAVFVFLFVFKFLKIFVHLFSYNFLSAFKIPTLNPSILPSDVTVIIPSVGDFGEEFERTVQTVLYNHPAKVIISTVGTDKLSEARRITEGIMKTERLPGQTIEVVAVHNPSKRAQCVHASLIVRTDLIAYADDHVIWPPTFLQSVLSEFEDPHVGIVGTCKRVIRDPGDSWSESIRNFLACLYLERHNYEMTATYNLDGGVWVISGRTHLIRTDIVQSLEYRQQFLSETFLGVGPINCDDDNFTTRYNINNGWKTVFHNRPEALIVTTLGTTGGWPKFYQQLIRWARSIWRSHCKTIFVEGKCWKFCPWTSYVMFISGLLNISIIYDPLLFFSLLNSIFYTKDNHAGAYLFWALFLSRMVKPWPYYMRHKSEMIWAVPVEFLFGYVHGAIRLIALFTCRDVSWSGRDLAEIKAVPFTP